MWWTLTLLGVVINPCVAFRYHSVTFPTSNRLLHGVGPLSASDSSTNPPETRLDPDIAAQFTIRVCTSTSCSMRLRHKGLDQYHVLGEISARAQEAGVEKHMIIEDGGCQGGINCRMGPCVGIMHEDFVGNVALEGMNSIEFREKVFHDVTTSDDTSRVWGCMENAVCLMAEEANANDEGENWV